jgi:hypothetical protein
MTNDKKALSSVAGCVHALADQPSVKSRPAKLAWRFTIYSLNCLLPVGANRETLPSYRANVFGILHRLDSRDLPGPVVAYKFITQVASNGNLQIKMHCFTSQHLPQR